MSITRRRFIRDGSILAALTLIAGCKAVEISKTSVNVATQTQTPEPPTATIQPSATLKPTDTKVPTVTPSPTETVMPTDTPTVPFSFYPDETTIKPTYGPNLITSNADMESGTTAWSASGAEISSASDERTGGVGSNSLQVVSTSGSGGARRIISTSAGKFLRFSVWAKYVSGVSKAYAVISKSNKQNLAVSPQASANPDWVNLFTSGRVTDAAMYAWLMTTNSTGVTARFDDVSVNELNFPSLFLFPTTAPYPSGTWLASVRVTNPVNSLNTFDHWAGLALNWDSPTNPQNGLLAVLLNDVINHFLGVVLFQITNGTTLTTITNGNLKSWSNYTATESIVVRLTGGVASIWYGGTPIGSGTITNQTVLNGRYHGIFATSNEGNIPTLSHLYVGADTAPKRLTILGDSIEANAHAWPLLVAGNKTPVPYVLTNRSVSGARTPYDGKHSSLAQLAAASSGDDADLIIIALGTNDTNGYAGAIQLDIQNAILKLRSTNPNATIVWLNVLPRWTDPTGSKPVDKSFIRSTIANACAKAGITCWDPYTDPWITSSDTTDGLNPNSSGNRKIADQILTRL